MALRGYFRFQSLSTLSMVPLTTTAPQPPPVQKGGGGGISITVVYRKHITTPTLNHNAYLYGNDCICYIMYQCNFCELNRLMLVRVQKHYQKVILCCAGKRHTCTVH